MIDAGKVVAALELDTSGFSQGLNTAQSMLNTWKSDSVGLDEKLKQTEIAMTSVGKVASTALTLPIVAAGTAAVATFTSFDDAMRQVQATMNATAEDAEKLAEAAKEAGISTRYSASEAASALNYLALAGYNADQAIEALPTVLRLAQAGGIDLASASDMVTDSMAALGLSMDQLNTFADQMAVTSQKSNTSVAQLGEAILTVGATAANLKGGTAELNAELGILADVGIKGAEGGTHLRNVILALQSPTSEAAEILAKYTNGVYDAEGNMRSLDVILGELKASMSTMTQASRDAIVSGLFNKTDLAAASSLIEASGERFAELTGYIEGADGAMSTMADTMEGGIGGAMRSLKSAIEGLAIEFGENIAPAVQRVAEWVTDLTRAFAALDEGTQNTIITIAAIAAAVGPAIIIIGKLAGAISMIATPVGAVIAGLALLGVAIAAISNANRSIDIGISAVEMEEYDLSDEVQNLGTQVAQVKIDIQNAGKSAYDQIVGIMNDGLPETDEERAAMADSVNAVINTAVKAIEDNYREKQTNLDLLFAEGLMSKEDYDTATAELTAKAEEQKTALTAEAQAVNDYVATLIAANAPMTEEQIAYLQTLIDKLVGISTQAAEANDAVMAKYKMAYERMAGGYGIEGDDELAATYIEYVADSQRSAVNAAHEATQAAFATAISETDSETLRDDLVSQSAADIEKQTRELAQIEAERAAMYGDMLKSWIDDNFNPAQFIEDYQPTRKVNLGGGASYTEEIDKESAWGRGLTADALAGELDGYDTEGLRSILGMWAANSGEEIDLSSNTAMMDAIVSMSQTIADMGATAEEAEPKIAAVKETMTEAAAGVGDEMDQGAEMAAAANSTVDGYVNGMAARHDDLWSAGAAAAAAVNGGFRATLGIHSPSAVMAQNGAYAVQGFVKGIQENRILADTAVQELGGSISQGARNSARGEREAYSSAQGNAITLNINGATIRKEEDIRSLARRLGSYINSVNHT